MSHDPQAEFRADVEAFLVRTGMAIAKFGDEACNDRSFVARLREGKHEVRWSTMRKVRSFMVEHEASASQVGAGAAGPAQAAE